MFPDRHSQVGQHREAEDHGVLESRTREPDDHCQGLLRLHPGCTEAAWRGEKEL